MRNITGIDSYNLMRKNLKDRFIVETDADNFKDIDVLTEDNIKYLLKLYNEIFLRNYFSLNFIKRIKVSLSNRMTSSGGKTIFLNKGRAKIYEIRISRVVLSKFIQDNKVKIVCGIEATDILEGLMLILEHELCHVIEFNKYGRSSCKQKQFKDMANSIFGHKSSYHEILKDNSSKNINKDKITFEIGQTVKFEYKSKIYMGQISNINKRATIMVEDNKGSYRDKNGKHYSKWYVPLTKIK